MIIKEYTTIDKSKWPKGEWNNEPDKVQWIDEKTGLDCLAVRQSWSGHWCGYVAVDSSHELYEKDYDLCDVEVHGGLTFDGHCQNQDDESVGICHVTQDGRPDNVWWFGFDCAHSGDFLPHSDNLHGEYTSYKNLKYVKKQCESLAAQLHTK